MVTPRRTRRVSVVAAPVLGKWPARAISAKVETLAHWAMIDTTKRPEQAYCASCRALVSFAGGTLKITEGVSVRTAACPTCGDEIVRVGGARAEG